VDVVFNGLRHSGRIESMERVVTIHRSFEDSDRADREYYRRLTPEQRLEILFELNERMDWGRDGKAAERLPRFYRILKRS
jgi:hypothetical protein